MRVGTQIVLNTFVALSRLIEKLPLAVLKEHLFFNVGKVVDGFWKMDLS